MEYIDCPIYAKQKLCSQCTPCGYCKAPSYKVSEDCGDCEICIDAHKTKEPIPTDKKTEELYPEGFI